MKSGKNQTASTSVEDSKLVQSGEAASGAVSTPQRIGDTTQYDVQSIHDQQERLKPVITVVGGLQIGKTLVLREPRITIGRDPESDLTLIDSGISRQHAELEVDNETQVVIRDLESTNGVRVNGDLVTEWALQAGDKIQLGPESVLKFRMEDPDEVTARVQQYEQSIRDDLTGIYNRRYFNLTLERELSYIRRRQTTSSLVLLDIDHFKQVNDRFGHRGGDQVLKLLTQTVADSIREEDVFARWGGEEFVLLLRGMDGADAYSIAERIRSQIAALRIKCGSGSLKATASFGVTEVDPEVHVTVEHAMHAVDGYLYKAKNQGRNTVVGQ